MRKLVDACINPDPEQRPDVSYVYDVAKRMYTPPGEAKWNCELVALDAEPLYYCSVSTKTKPSTFQHSVIKPLLSDLFFGTVISLAVTVFQLVCVMPAPRKMFQTKLHLGDKQNSQTVKTTNAEICSALTEHVEPCAQKVHREPNWQKQRVGNATDLMAAKTVRIKWCSFIHSTNSLFQFCKTLLK